MQDEMIIDHINSFFNNITMNDNTHQHYQEW